MRTEEQLRDIEIADFDLSLLSDNELVLLENLLHNDWENGELHSLSDYSEIIRELTIRETK